MKKLVSILLTLTMILGIFSVIPMSAHAQTLDPDKVYVKTDGQYYEAEKGQIFTYQHLVSVDSTKKVSGFDVNVYYDTEGLDFVPYFDEYGDEDATRHFPSSPNGLVHNFNIDGEIIYTCSNYRGMLFDDNSVMFTGQFEVTASSGVYEIDSKIKNLADTDLCVIVYLGEKYDEYEESESITDLKVVEGITDAPTEPVQEKFAVYFVDSVNAHTSRKDAPMFAHAVKGVAGSEDYIENAELPGQYLARVAMTSPDGAQVRKVFIDKCFDRISFGYSNGYPPRPSTPYVEIKDGWFYDNGTNQWYEKLEDIPAYNPTETPVVTEAPVVPTQADVTEAPQVSTEKPVPIETQKPTTKPSDKYDDIDGLYVVADGVFYEVEKGQTFTYQYNVSVDKNRRVAGFDVNMFYDTEGLDFIPYKDEYGDDDVLRHFPKTPSGLVYNFNIDGEILYNFGILNGVILNDCVLFEGQFVVTAESGVYEIDSRMITLGDTDMSAIVYQGEVYDNFEDKGIITDLSIAEDIVVPTEPENKKITVYFVDSVNANTSKKEAAMFAHAVKGVAGSNDYKENEKAPGQYMVKVALKSPDGAYVRKVYIEEGFDTISFGYSNSYPQKPSTPYVEIKDGWFYDNGTNQWYEKLEDIPKYIPTEAPTVIPTEKPTVKPTVRPSETTEDDSDVYLVADGVTYVVNKGDKIVYRYYLSVDNSIKISSLNVHMTYDTKGLDLVPYIDEYGDEDVYTHFPNIFGGVVHNFGIDGKIYYNYSSVSGVRLVDDTLIFEGLFEVTADKGTYNIDSRIITLADKDMNRIVYEGKVVQDIVSERVDLGNSTIGDGNYGDIIYPTDGDEVSGDNSKDPTDAPGLPSAPDDNLDDPQIPPIENSTEPVAEYELGNVNRDDKINVFDVTAIQRYAAFYEEFDDGQLTLADVNFDGKVNIFDATEVQRFVAGQITKFEKK